MTGNRNRSVTRYDRAVGRVLQGLEDTRRALDRLLTMKPPEKHHDTAIDASGLSWLLEMMSASFICEVPWECYPRRERERLARRGIV